MFRPLMPLLMFSILAACSDRSQDVNLQEKIKGDTSTNSQQIIFDEPQQIDSSPIVIYPLILAEQSYGSRYTSSSSGQRTSYWNLIFYNTQSQNHNLLVEDRKLFITSINIGSSSSSSDDLWINGINIYKDNIFYNVVAKDYNGNMLLDENDPTYLFVSNRDGTSFRQVSPDDYHVNSWEVVKGTTKIIMEGQKDKNGDKVFNDEDSSVPLVVDVKSGKTATEAFRKDFIDSLKQRLVKIWKQ